MNFCFTSSGITDANNDGLTGSSLTGGGVSELNVELSSTATGNGGLSSVTSVASVELESSGLSPNEPLCLFNEGNLFLTPLNVLLCIGVIYLNYI